MPKDDAETIIGVSVNPALLAMLDKVMASTTTSLLDAIVTLLVVIARQAVVTGIPEEELMSILHQIMEQERTPSRKDTH